MEVLPVPLSTNAVSSTFGGIYSSVVSTTGSTLLGYVVVTLVIFSLCFLLWTVGNWLYNLFIDRQEKHESEVKYFDGNGQPITVSVTA